MPGPNSNSNPSWLDTLAAYGRDNPITQAADYWSQDNARFDAGNPSTTDKVLRSINPMTAFGSAMGQMQDAAGSGDKMAMALAAFGAMPAFGKLKAAQVPIEGLIHEAARVPSLARTLANVAENTATGVGVDALTSGPKGK